MTLFAQVLEISSDALGYVGLAVVAVAVVVLLVSTFHPEGRRRPGGYLDGKAPQPEDLQRERDDERDAPSDR
jgi:hypothetical protein